MCGKNLLLLALVPVVLFVVVPELLSLALRTEFNVVPAEKALVMVTGTSSGLGFFMVKDLQQRGYSVLAGVRKQADAVKITEEFGSKGPGKVRPIILDITKQADRDNAAVEFEKVAKEWGLTPYALLNNAGGGKYKPTEITTAQDDHWAFDLGVVGPTQLTRALMPSLRTHKGRALFVGSTADHFGGALFSSYASTKAALHQYVLIMRREMIHQGVAVTHIWQGPAESRFKENAFGEDLNPCTFKAEVEGHPSAEKYCQATAEMIQTFGNLPADGEMGYSLIDAKRHVAIMIDTLASPYPPPEVYTSIPGRLMVFIGSLPEIVKDKMFAL